METAEIMFSEWLPTRPTYKNPGCLVANNCIPAEGGYKPLQGINLGAESFEGTCMGAALFFKGDTPFIVGGTADSLFTREGSTTDETTGYNAVPSDEFWDFCQFGTMIFATSSTNAPQYLANYTAATTWGAVGGSPPTARFCGRVGEFLMLGNLSTGAHQFAWSAFNNPTGAWAASRLTQAGTANAPLEYGAVQRVVGGRYGLLFQERAINRLDYVGPPVVWRRSEIEVGRGTTAPASVVTVGYLTFFLAQDGFYVTNGSQVTPIGSDKVNQWFFDNVNQARLSLTHAAVDWVNECVFWAFQTGSVFDRVIIYSWAQNRWSSGTLTVEWLVGSRRDGVSLEDLDALFPGGLEDVTPSLDDDSWTAGARIMAAFVGVAGDTTYARLDGETLAAEWETGAYQPLAGRRVFVTECHPIFDADDWTMQFAAVSADNERAVTVGAYSSPGVAGFCPVRADGRLIRVAARTLAGALWEKAQGVQVAYRPSGWR